VLLDIARAFSLARMPTRTAIGKLSTHLLLGIYASLAPLFMSLLEKKPPLGRVQHLGAARHERAPDCPLHRPAALRRRVRFFAQVWMVWPFRHGVPHSAGGVLRPPSTYTTASWRTNSRSRGSWSPKRSTIFSAMKWCRISQPTRRCSASGTMSLTPRFMRACPQGAGDAHFSARPLRAEICVTPVCELSAVGLAHVYRGGMGEIRARYMRGTCAVHARLTPRRSCLPCDPPPPGIPRSGFFPYRTAGAWRQPGRPCPPYAVLLPALWRTGWERLSSPCRRQTGRPE